MRGRESGGRGQGGSTVAERPLESDGALWTPAEILTGIPRVRDAVTVVASESSGAIGVTFGPPARGVRVLGTLPPLYPEWLGDRTFLAVHQVRFPYVAGAMANGIASPKMVSALANAGLLAFLGCAGLDLQTVEHGLAEIRASTRPQAVWGANLIHSPQQPDLEHRLVDLLLRENVRHVEASAFMALSPSVARYAYRGIHVDRAGRVQRPNRVLAKVSRPEVAQQFLKPAPQAMLNALVAEGRLSADEASLAARLPVAEDVTAEADSGGHTDNRPLGVLLPLLIRLRDSIQSQYRYERPLRVGAAGGLGTPAGVAGAFAMGAAFVLTGSVNQSSVESGMSPAAKALLAKAGMADVTMAPAADMFEMGIRVQVLKRGTMFAPRGARLYEMYRQYASLEDLPADDRQWLERDVFRAPVSQVWEETRAFWERREPAVAARAESDPRHRMALVFRWYLGKASRWAITGEPSRTLDYQLWCGPAMGGFNDWVRGSFLEPPENRQAVQIAFNLLEGAAVVTRAQQLRTFGVPVPPEALDFRPRRFDIGGEAEP